MKRNNTKHPPARGSRRVVGTPPLADKPNIKGSRRVLAWMRRNFGTASIAIGMIGAFVMVGLAWSGRPWWESLEASSVAFFFIGMGVGWNVRNDRAANIRYLGPNTIMRCRECHERDRW